VLLTKVIFFVHSLLFLTDAVLRDLGVASYFNPILLSEDTGFEKPSPEIFLRACRESDDSRTPSKPEECVHVGDELDWSVSYATS
jgi:HAD superfamily hydrolase (TIGR01549 family)